MKKNPIAYVEHIIKNIDLINEFIANMSKEEFFKNHMCYDAVLYNLQTMAESTQRLPQAIKAAHTQIAWKTLSGFRNVLVHEYLGDIDPEIIWFAIKERLPALKETLLKIQKELQTIDEEKI